MAPLGGLRPQHEARRDGVGGRGQAGGRRGRPAGARRALDAGPGEGGGFGRCRRRCPRNPGEGRGQPAGRAGLASQGAHRHPGRAPPGTVRQRPRSPPRVRSGAFEGDAGRDGAPRPPGRRLPGQRRGCGGPPGCGASLRRVASTTGPLGSLRGRHRQGEGAPRLLLPGAPPGGGPRRDRRRPEHRRRADGLSVRGRRGPRSRALHARCSGAVCRRRARGGALAGPDSAGRRLHRVGPVELRTGRGALPVRDGRAEGSRRGGRRYAPPGAPERMGGGLALGGHRPVRAPAVPGGAGGGRRAFAPDLEPG